MMAIILRTGTHDERLESLRHIAAYAKHCDNCLHVSATLMQIFKAAVRAQGLSEIELRRLRNELTPEDATADEIEFIDQFIGDLTPGSKS